MVDPNEESYLCGFQEKKGGRKKNVKIPHSWKKSKAEHKNMWNSESCETIFAQYGKLWKEQFGMWKCMNRTERSTIDLQYGKVWTRVSVYVAFPEEHSACIQKAWETLSWAAILKGLTFFYFLPGLQTWGEF